MDMATIQMEMVRAFVIDSVPGGLFLVRINRVDYHCRAQKPFYEFHFVILDPRHVKGCFLKARLYCTPRAMWKLNWLLRDFGYDSDLLAKGEVDDRALVGLEGVIKVSYATVRGLFVLNLDGFAPAEKWKELSPLATDEPSGAEVA